MWTWGEGGLMSKVSSLRAAGNHLTALGRWLNGERTGLDVSTDVLKLL